MNLRDRYTSSGGVAKWRSRLNDGLGDVIRHPKNWFAVAVAFIKNGNNGNSSPVYGLTKDGTKNSKGLNMDAIPPKIKQLIEKKSRQKPTVNDLHLHFK